MLRYFLFLALGVTSVHFTFANEKTTNVKAKVGLCVMATGRYDVYAEEMIRSARPYFCTNSDVTYFVFGDGTITAAPDVVQVSQKRLGWPHDTLKRFEVYLHHSDRLSEMDYLFALDADMRFVAPVGEEILSDLVGTQHPGFVGKRGSYESDPASTACVSKKEGKTYFAGGFYGGKREEFFKLLKKTKEQIDKDLERDFIAVWHDESHLNRYFIDHPPTLVLNPSYCYPECMTLDFPKKLMALDKDHEQMRK